jgi:hypothetical protein
MAWRPGFLGWLAIALALLLLPLLALALWSRTSGDLERFARHATERGFAIDWRNHPASGPPSETLLTIRRLVQLQAGLKTYAEDQGEPDSDDPIPAALLAHHRGLPAEDVRAWEETASSLTSLPRTACNLDANGLCADVWAHSDIWDFAGERVRCADPSQLVEALIRYAGLTHAIQAGTSIEQSTLCYRLGRWIHLVLLRREDLAGHQEEIAALCDRLAESIPDDTLDALANDHIPFLLAWQEGQRRNDPLYLERCWNNALPAIMMIQGLDRLIVRSGRGEILDRLLRRAELARTCRDLQTMIRQEQVENESLKATSRYSFRTWYARGMGHLKYSQWHDIFATQLRLRLLAADLRGLPWPIDPWDPAGARLRPLLRDGVVIGAYSLGLNGIDDHGIASTGLCNHCAGIPPLDICFNLVVRKPAPP